MNRIFILAGQSNISRLSIGERDSSLELSNVKYFDIDTKDGQEYAAEPLMTFGHALGEAFPDDTIKIVQWAVEGSALRQEYSQVGGLQFPYWIGDDFNLRKLIKDEIKDYNFEADEINIVWSQGETDAIFGCPLNLYVYSLLWLLTTMGKMINPKLKVNAYLMPIGVNNLPAQDINAWNTIKAAYAVLDGITTEYLETRIAAQHDDLPLIDAYHHDLEGYIEIGRRLAQGIKFFKGVLEVEPVNEDQCQPSNLKADPRTGLPLTSMIHQTPATKATT